MDVCSLSHVGKVREKNEDTVYVSGSGAPLLAMVADGMGGQAAGKTASSTTVSYISYELKDRLKRTDEKTLASVAVKASDRIFEISKRKEEYKNMGTTLAAAIVDSKKVCAVNIGDSRIYKFGKDGLKQVTKDHKYVQYLVEKGFLTQQEADIHPYRNIITRAVGMEDVTPDTFTFEWEISDTLLICSDGLYDEVSKEEISEVLSKRGSARQKAQTLMEKALNAGGRDNVSVIVIINDNVLGSVIKNRFEIRRLVDEGGMSRVYRAYDRKQMRSVAVKVLKEEFQSNKQIVNGFLKEGEVTSRLAHKNIVRIVDYGTRGSMRYIVMEYIEGSTLAALMEKERLPIEKSVSIAKKLLSALSYSHHRGVVHRDLKPRNVLIDLDGEPYLTDFGIAGELGEQEINNDEKVVGSVNYFSPEQATGQKTGVSTDIYSMGIMLYEMCTGRLPFVAEDKLSVALMHLHTPPVAPKEIEPSLPESLNKIILKAIEKKPEDRYQSASAMGRDIARCLTEKSGAYVKEAKEEKRRRLKNKRLIPVISIALSVAAALTFAVIFLISRGSAFKTIYMPNLIDKTEDAAMLQLNEYGLDLDITITYEKGISMEDGKVISQSPEAGKTLKDNDKVTVIVSKNQDELPDMPDLSGKTEEQAKQILKDMGIQPSNIVTTQTNYEDVENGIVYSQYPDAGAHLKEDTAVILYINRIFVYSDGKIPDVYGLDTEDAVYGLRFSKYNFGRIWIYEDYEASGSYGTVFDQSPKSGEAYSSGQDIKLYTYALSQANYGSSFKLKKSVAEALLTGKEKTVTVTLSIQRTTETMTNEAYAGAPIIDFERVVFEKQLSYDEAVNMKKLNTDFKLYLENADEADRYILNYYVDGELFETSETSLKKLN